MNLDDIKPGMTQAQITEAAKAILASGVYGPQRQTANLDPKLEEKADTVAVGILAKPASSITNDESQLLARQALQQLRRDGYQVPER
jgi:hypothetical protein